MTIAEREQQILRVRAQGIHPELEAAFAEQLQTIDGRGARDLLPQLRPGWEVSGTHSVGPHLNVAKSSLK